MALRVLLLLLWLALCYFCSFSAELVESLREEFGSNITRTNSGVISFPLMNIHSDASPFRRFNSTRSSWITEILKSDTDRQQALFQRKTNPTQAEEGGEVPLASGAAIDNGNYIIKLSFGTPAQSIYTMLDTGSDVAWIPCNSCKGCMNNQIFETGKSSTFELLSCSSNQCEQGQGTCGKGNNCVFNEVYADGARVDALLSSDELTTEGNDKASKNVRLSRFIFGCSNARSGLLKDAPGLVGFARGTLSFVSQTADVYGKVFSYCLPSLYSVAFSGSLSLGKEILSSTQGLRFTPLLPNPPGFPSFYYVGLIAIRVGKERFVVPREISRPTSTGGGIVIDSGTVITRLVEPFYSRVRDSFRRQMNLTMTTPFKLLDTCYQIPSGGNLMVPRIALHFQQRLYLVLPEESILVATDYTGSNVCLAFASAGRGPDAISVFGNYQQQNLRIVYDVPGSRLGIAPENCDH